MFTFFLAVWNLPKSIKILIASGLIIAAVGGYIGWLTHERSKAEKAAAAAETERKRLQMQNDGMKILQNTATIAQEVENDKKLANRQAVNSAIATNNFTNSVRRDSGTFAGNSTDEFCKRFCGDSTCARWRELHGCP